MKGVVRALLVSAVALTLALSVAPAGAGPHQSGACSGTAPLQATCFFGFRASGGGFGMGALRLPTGILSARASWAGGEARLLCDLTGCTGQSTGDPPAYDTWIEVAGSVLGPADPGTHVAAVGVGAWVITASG